MLYNQHDIYVGRSLDLYGEFSEAETHLFRQILHPGDFVVEVGANIGAHTVFLAQLVGPTGSVMAFEPQRIVFQTLCGNLALNSITNVAAYQQAVGSQLGQIVVPKIDYARQGNFGGLALGGHNQGEVVTVVTLDSLNVRPCRFLKIDVEGMEKTVLQGAVRTIAQDKPLIYVENDRREKSDELIGFIDSLGYKMYWHRPRLFNPENFFGNAENVFANIISLNMLCIPVDVPYDLTGFAPVEIRAIG
jgi:FkbM family methyltransferase